MKEQILKLREEGKTYNEIIAIIGCAKSTVAYHCGKGVKEKSRNRTRKLRTTVRGKMFNKFDKFFRSKILNFKRGKPNGITKAKFNYYTSYAKLIKNPYCYLTGEKINLEESRSYELDHIIPLSKGGKYTLGNLGLTTKEANRAKADLNVEDFFLLCKKVLEHNGYKVIK